MIKLAWNYNPGENIYRKIPPPTTFNVEKAAEVDTSGKNTCLFQHSVRLREHFWNSLNLRKIHKYLFHHCLNIWRGMETYSDWKFKLSTTLFRYWIWVRIKPTILILITGESDFLKNLCFKTPTAWENSIDEWWKQLEDKGSKKPHMCATLADTISLLQESIYTEAVNIFGHLQPKKSNLTGQRRRTKLSIQLIQQKNLLLA